MGNFDRDNRRPDRDFNRGFGGGGRSFGGGNRFGGGNNSRPVMHKATCSECGADCEIPFRPTGDRPVYCSKCFEKQGNSGGSSNRPNRFGGGERRERTNFEDRQMHDTICAKCGKECKVPFAPRAGKPVFCDDCFEKGGKGNLSEVVEQINVLNSKVDKLIKFLMPETLVEKTEKIKIKKEEVLKDVVKEKKEKRKSVSKKVSAKKKK